MKILGKIQSNVGHQKLDYLTTITQKEMQVLKTILLDNKKKFVNGSSQHNVLIEIRRVLAKVKSQKSSG